MEMDGREILISIRPDIQTVTENVIALEQFQNQTLRPILKFQHELLISVFRHYIEKRKGAFHQLAPKDKPAYLEHAIRQDLRFKSQLLGIVIGHFTQVEFQQYCENEAELSRRLTDLLVQRIVSQSSIL
jgi:hypothetical protein